MTQASSALVSALFEIQKAVGGGVKKDAKNDHFNSSYATLGAVVRHVLPACIENGVLMQVSTNYSNLNNTMTGEVVLTHVETGERERYTKTIPMGQKVDPQAAGSAATYCTRYLLQEVFLLPPVDDDGEAAMQRAKSPMISPSQLGALEVLIAQKGVKTELICKHAGVSSLSEMKVTDYHNIVDRLKDKPDV